MKSSFAFTFAFLSITLLTAACDVTVSDPSEDACNNFDKQCKGAKTLDADGNLVSVPACDRDQFSKYKNSTGVQSCVTDATSCGEATSCIDGAQRK